MWQVRWIKCELCHWQQIFSSLYAQVSSVDVDEKMLLMWKSASISDNSIFHRNSQIYKLGLYFQLLPSSENIGILCRSIFMGPILKT